MLSFNACFWNNDIYINEKNKYAANEILTAYLNTNRLDEAEDDVYELKSLCRKLLISVDMDYDHYENYNRNVCDASSIFDKINHWLLKLPPYKNILRFPIRTLEDLLNDYPLFFDDGMSDESDICITPDTVTERGFGEMLDNGNYTIRLTKFVLYEPKSLTSYGPEANEDLLDFNRDIKEFFDNYIAFLNSYIAVHRVFKPFIAEYLHSKNGFPQQNEIAELFEKFNREHGNSFISIKCSMQSFGYKVLNDQQGKPILCEKISFKDLQSFLFYDFFNGIKLNYIPNKCRQCGKFFLIRSGKYYSYCDRPVRKEPGKTCRDIGARKRYAEKCRTDPVWLAYNRAYKAHYARYMKKKMSVSEFEKWSRFASAIRDLALDDKISFEDYSVEIKR